ncbi:MAG: hypothetical protein H7270_09240 [Dermatophilaceae bacterium]|nr:hypothetical protein [Dermatophilaceae bacterium]
MTAPPGAPFDTSQDPDHVSEKPGAAAFGLLSRAQALADQLRSEVRAEAAALRAEDAAAHIEASRLLADATNVHEDALSVQRSAQARLREAQQEAAQLVGDAADQASLVAAAAERATETLLASTQIEVDDLRNATRAEDLRLRDQAAAGLEQGRENIATLLAEAAAGIAAQQEQVAAELHELREEAVREATSIRTAAQEFAAEAITRADTEASTTHAITTSELTHSRAEIAGLRATAADEISSLRDAATAEADRVLGDAADHMRWTQDTVQSLLSTAEAETTRLRLAGHETNAAHLARRRKQLHNIISRVALRARALTSQAAADAERLRGQADAILDVAQRDTVATRERAAAHAARVIGEADLTAQAALERGQRRLDEAEAGARVLRERAAAEVLRLQTEAHDHRRAVRDEATTTLAAARADANTSRTHARDLLTQARAEVKVLAERRDDITAQLGHLSGVIEALAVPERSAVLAGRCAPDAADIEPTPENATPHLCLTATATTGTR